MSELFMLFFVLFCVTFFGIIQGKITECEKLSSCSCDTGSGVIDLAKVASSDGGPRFKDVQSAPGDKFSYNPCSPFTEGTCKDVAACQVQGLLPPAYFNIGTQDSATFSVDPSKGLQITYSADTFLSSRNLTFLRKAVVTLVCDESKDPGDLTADGETPAGSGTYPMTLTSKYACEQPAGLSPGSVLLIVALVLLLVYLTGGFSIQKFVRHAEGKETIPNFSFWSSIPGLIKDGVLFSVGLCGLRSGITKSKTYDEM